MYSINKNRVMSHWVWMNRSNNSKGSRKKIIHRLTNIYSRRHITRRNISKMMGNSRIKTISTKSNKKIKSSIIFKNKIKTSNNINYPHMSHWVFKTTPLLMRNNNNPTPISCNSPMKTNTNNNRSKTKITNKITKNSNKQMDMSLYNLIDQLAILNTFNRLILYSN